jgi:hypothetical protein
MRNGVVVAYIELHSEYCLGCAEGNLVVVRACRGGTAVPNTSAFLECQFVLWSHYIRQ